MTGEFDWMDAAACKGYPTGWWFPERGDLATAMKAKAVCERCPVTRECLELGRKVSVHGGGYGIWGGVSMTTDRKMRRQAS